MLPRVHRNKKQGTGKEDLEAVIGAPARSHQPILAEGVIDISGWKLAELVPDLRSWCARLDREGLLSVDPPGRRSSTTCELTVHNHHHPNITTAYG